MGKAARSPFRILKEQLKILKQNAILKGMKNINLAPEDQWDSTFQKMMFDTPSLKVPGFIDLHLYRIHIKTKAVLKVV